MHPFCVFDRSVFGLSSVYSRVCWSRMGSTTTCITEAAHPTAPYIRPLRFFLFFFFRRPVFPGPPGRFVAMRFVCHLTAFVARWSRLLLWRRFCRCTTQHKSCSHGDATPSSSTPRCRSMMDSLVYLPLANNVPDSEVDRWVVGAGRPSSPGSHHAVKSTRRMRSTSRVV